MTETEMTMRYRYVAQLRLDLTDELRARLDAARIHVYRQDPGEVTLEVWAAHPLNARTQIVAALDPTDEYRRDHSKVLDFVNDCPRLGVQ